LVCSSFSSNVGSVDNKLFSQPDSSTDNYVEVYIRLSSSCPTGSYNCVFYRSGQAAPLMSCIISYPASDICGGWAHLGVGVYNWVVEGPVNFTSCDVLINPNQTTYILDSDCTNCDGSDARKH
jgi:hypothetical protein